ncbi:hypothetical protein VTK56DRAFT_4160 [Thermocarpiscus australiensis]
MASQELPDASTAAAVLQPCHHAHHGTISLLGESGEPTGSQVSNRAATNLRIPMKNCIICREDYLLFQGQQIFPCLHFYCRRCLKNYIQLGIRDEEMFPPECCDKPIVPDTTILPRSLVIEYEARKEELETQDKTYCAVKHCSAFIPTRNIEATARWATCPRCGTATCLACKTVAHSGSCEGRTDPEEVRVHRMAEENGWRRCFSCKRYVALASGCNHVTCRCGAQFCYVCGRVWKSCSCLMFFGDDLFDEWDEDEAEGFQCRHALCVRIPMLLPGPPPWCLHCLTPIASGFYWRCLEPRCRIELCVRCYLNNWNLLNRPFPPVIM